MLSAQIIGRKDQWAKWMLGPGCAALIQRKLRRWINWKTVSVSQVAPLKHTESSLNTKLTKPRQGKWSTRARCGWLWEFHKLKYERAPLLNSALQQEYPTTRNISAKPGLIFCRREISDLMFQARFRIEGTSIGKSPGILWVTNCALWEVGAVVNAIQIYDPAP